MEISDAGVAFIEAHEGCKLEAYLDSVGIPTIGYGHTSGVSEGDTCTQEQADQWLRDDLSEAEDCVNKVVAVPLTQNQFDALCSFTFNLGCGALKGSTLLRLLNQGDTENSAKEFVKWDRAGGKVVAGLLKRRQDEQALFNS